jgi:hypothetical protein
VCGPTLVLPLLAQADGPHRLGLRWAGGRRVVVVPALAGQPLTLPTAELNPAAAYTLTIEQPDGEPYTRPPTPPDTQPCTAFSFLTFS